MSNAKNTGLFDVKTVEALAALMSKHDISEIALRDNTQQLRLRRGSLVASVAAPTIAMAAPASVAPPATAGAGPNAAPAPAKNHLIEIKSETVGTFYAQAKPGEPPYVKKGDRVKPDTVIGQVEVMKTYNPLTANCTGVIVDVVVENGKYVEFGEVLFRVDPT